MNGLSSSSLNVDYWSGTGTIGLVTDMVQLRYANYPKDYFMGMLPSSQYGSVAVLPSSYDMGGAASNRIITDPLSSPLRVVDGSSNVSVAVGVRPAVAVVLGVTLCVGVTVGVPV